MKWDGSGEIPDNNRKYIFFVEPGLKICSKPDKVQTGSRQDPWSSKSFLCYLTIQLYIVLAPSSLSFQKPHVRVGRLIHRLQLRRFLCSLDGY